jgi:hypothetical protein
MSKLTTAALAGAAMFANEDRILQDTGSGYKPGQIYFANDSRLIETFYSEPLTTYSVGWRDPSPIESTLQFLAPEVPVGRRFEWKRANNAEEFLSETIDDQRAIGSDFKRVEYTATDVTDKTLNKGLGLVVDLDNVSGPNWRQEKTAKLLRRLLRNELRRAVTALSGAATNTAKTWDTSAGKDPDQDVRDDLITAATATGIRPNRVLYGDTAFNLRLKAHRAQASAGGFASAGMTPEQIAAELMVDQILVSKERYQSGASAKTEIVANKVIMFYAQNGVDTEDASHIKRFVTMHPTEQGGGRFRVFEQQLSSKLVLLTVEHYSKIVVTFSTGIRQFTIS